MTALLMTLLAIGLPPSLTSKASTAFADIQKAKTALNAGHTITSESWLTKAEGLLKSVLGSAPGGSLLGKLGEAQPAAKQGDSQQSTNAVSQAEAEAQKLDPSLASKLGVAGQKAQPGDLSSARTDIASKTGLGELEDAYQKVSTARSLLHSGETSKAKSLLDQIPSLPQL